MDAKTPHNPPGQPAKSPVVKKRFSWPKRILMGMIGFLLILCLITLCLRIFITLPIGHDFIEKQVNSSSFGPIKSVKIEGLSGDPLSNFSIGSVELADKDGVWGTSQNISVDWHPLSLLRKHVNVEALNIDAVSVLRSPTLLPTEPADLSLKFTLEQAFLPKLALAPELLPSALLVKTQDAPLTLSLDGGFSALMSGDIKARLEALRTDGPADSPNDALNLDFTKSDEGIMSGTFDLRANANGVLAALIQAPKGQTTIGTGVLSGDLQSGDGDFTLNFDTNKALASTIKWTPDTFTLSAEVPGRDWPLLAPLKAVNGTPKLSLNIERTDSEMPFQLNSNIGPINLSAEGLLPPLDTDSSRLPSQAKIDLSVRDPSILLSEFITLPEGLAFSNLRVVGQVDNSDIPRFKGIIRSDNITTPVANIDTINAPLTVSYTEQKTILFDLRTALNGLTPKDGFPINLNPKTDITAKGVYNTQTQSLQLSSAKLISGEQNVTAKGSATLEPLSYALTGRANINLAESGNIPAGMLRTDYTVNKDDYPLPSVKADGVFSPIAPLITPLDRLIGDQLVFDVDMTPMTNGFNLTKVSLRADGFKGEASGTITDTLNVSVEADLLSDLLYQDISLAENTQISAVIMGTQADPTIKLDSTTPKVAFREHSLSDVRLRAEITDVISAPKGPLRLTAMSEYGDLDINTTFTSTQESIEIDDLMAELGKFSLRGDMKLIDAPSGDKKLAIGTLSLDLPEEGDRYAKAVLTLTAQGGEQGLSVDAEAKNIAYNSIGFDSFTLTGDGTLSAFSGTLSTEGQSGSGLIKTPFLIESPITLARNANTTVTASLSPNANYGRIPLRSSKPLTLTIDDGNIVVSGGFSVRDGTISLDYKNGEAERLELTIANMPVNILPLGTALSETRGRTNVELDIGFVGGQANGTLAASIKDWRGFERNKSEAITINVKGELVQNAMDIKITGTSPLNFDIDGATRVALTHSASLASLRPNMDATLDGRLRANGAAGALLGLVTPKESALKGQLGANLSLSGTLSSPQAQGEINGNSLRFEAPQMGTQIRDGRFALGFTNDSLTLTELSAIGSKKGTLKGSGAFKLGAFGRPIGKMEVELERLQALDRRDMSARLSGPVSVEIKEDTTLIGGAITVLNAEIKQFVTGGVNVVEIEVEEINAPPNIQNAQTEGETPALPVDIDLKISAPRKLFVRSKGLDVELSLDAEIKGTLDAPQVFGQADILRGGYSIAGKTLDFDSGTVKFTGDIPKGRLDFLASTQTQNLEATVEITGTVQDPEITLASTPSRPQDEILSAILFGRSATELSTLEAAQLAGAIAQFSGNGGFDLLGGFRDALGIGQLSLGFNEDGGAMITGGRYLAKNVYLQVFSGVGSNDSGAVIDWEIRKNISLRSRLQSDNDQSLSLKWKRDF